MQEREGERSESRSEKEAERERAAQTHVSHELVILLVTWCMSLASPAPHSHHPLPHPHTALTINAHSHTHTRTHTPAQPAQKWRPRSCVLGDIFYALLSKLDFLIKFSSEMRINFIKFTWQRTAAWASSTVPSTTPPPCPPLSLHHLCPLFRSRCRLSFAATFFALEFSCRRRLLKVIN